jgi:hypothetical protein
LREYPELTILVDGVEQPKRRPSDQQRQKSDYSGKKKRHTLKQILTATPSGIIVDQSRSCGGRRHDFALFKERVSFKEHVSGDSVSATCVEEEPVPVEEPAGKEPTARKPPGEPGFYQQLEGLRVVGYADSGFTGLDGLGLPMSTRLVERGRRGHLLSAKQKSLNRVRSRERIKIEHVLSRRKKYRIASEVYRNRDADYDPTMNVVGGLVNLRAYGRLDALRGVDLMGMHL